MFAPARAYIHCGDIGSAQVVGAVVIAVVALAEIANKKHQRGEPSQNLAYAAAGLTIVNAAIAFLW